MEKIIMTRVSIFAFPILLSVILGCRFLPAETGEVRPPAKTVLSQSVLTERLTLKGVSVETQEAVGKLSPVELRLRFGRSPSDFELNDESYQQFTDLLAKLLEIRRERDLSGVYAEGTNTIHMKITIPLLPQDIEKYNAKKISVEDFERLVDDLKKERFDQIELRFSEPSAPLVESPLKRGASGSDSRSAPKVISGGIVNGKAAKLAKPEYPAAARAVRATGAVNVRVLIDEKGDVIEAEAVSGHPLLKASAVKAARESKFVPTLLSGKPIRVSGIIAFNFSDQEN